MHAARTHAQPDTDMRNSFCGLYACGSVFHTCSSALSCLLDISAHLPQRTGFLHGLHVRRQPVCAHRHFRSAATALGGGCSQQEGSSQLYHSLVMHEQGLSSQPFSFYSAGLLSLALDSLFLRSLTLHPFRSSNDVEQCCLTAAA